MRVSTISIILEKKSNLHPSFDADQSHSMLLTCALSLSLTHLHSHCLFFLHFLYSHTLYRSLSLYQLWLPPSKLPLWRACTKNTTVAVVGLRLFFTQGQTDQTVAWCATANANQGALLDPHTMVQAWKVVARASNLEAD
jgi:hypothetical protein